MERNNPKQSQTVHVALPLKLIRRLKELAQTSRRSLNAQATILIEEALNNGKHSVS